MSDEKDAIYKEIAEFIDSHFSNREYFSCIYGSRAYGLHKRCSDIDYFLACQKYNKPDLKDLITFTINLHRTHALPLDNEVPFERKLIITFDELEKAVNCKGLSTENSRVFIQPIIKTKKFLSSKEVQLRLFFNVLTTKNIFLTGNRKIYKSFTEKAEFNLLLLGIHLVNKSKFTLNEIIDKLLYSSEGEEGELYLGYKIDKRRIAYLQRLLLKNINKMVKLEMLNQPEKYLSFRRDETLKAITDRYLSSITK